MLLAVLRICLGDGGRKRDVAKGSWLKDGVMQGHLHLEVNGTAQSKARQFMATKNSQTCPGASQVGHQEEFSTLQPKGWDGKCGRPPWLLEGLEHSCVRTVPKKVRCPLLQACTNPFQQMPCTCLACPVPKAFSRGDPQDHKGGVTEIPCSKKNKNSKSGSGTPSTLLDHSLHWNISLLVTALMSWSYRRLFEWKFFAR